MIDTNSLPAPDDLEAVVPPQVEITAGGQTYTITPIKLGQLPRVIRAISPVLGSIDRTLPPEAAVKKILLTHPEVVLRVLEAATPLHGDAVEALALDEAAALIGAVVQCNVDFFEKAVAPALARLTADIEAAKQPSPPPAGPTPSSC
jgi:hypothetical protein